MAVRRELVIIGAGGHATSVASIAIAAGLSVRCFVDPSRAGGRLLGTPIVARVSSIRAPQSFIFAIAIGDNSSRQRALKSLTEKYGRLSYIAIIHPSAIVAAGAQIGPGVVVMPLACVGPNSVVGRFCIINTAAILDHDGKMQPFSSLAPGVVTGGSVSIGERAAVSIGAVISNGCTIGRDCVVGANSFVNQNMPPRVVAYGSPARPIRPRLAGDPYLK